MLFEDLFNVNTSLFFVVVLLNPLIIRAKWSKDPFVLKLAITFLLTQLTTLCEN